MKTDLIEIFQSIRASMQPYAAKGFSVKTNSENEYDLWSYNNVVFAGKKRHEIHFATVKINKNYVALHFMPVYVDADIKALFHQDLLMLLKGKACFHIKKLDNELLQHIVRALDAGDTLYKQKQWV